MLPVVRRSLADVVVTLGVVFGLFTPVTIANSLFKVPEVTGRVVFMPVATANSLVKVLEATGIIAAIISALAVGLKPKTLQMFAMAPKVAERDEHAPNEPRGLVTDLAGSRYLCKPDRRTR